MSLLGREDVYFDEAEWDALLETLRSLRVTDGHERGGESLQLLDWQCWVYGSLLCWKRTETGGRMMKRLFVEVGRGAGKTVGSAAILVHLARHINNWECSVLANTVQQSTICYTAIGQFIRDAYGTVDDEDRDSEWRVTERKILNTRTGAEIVRRAAKTGTLDGLKGSFLIDESSEQTTDWMKKITSALPKQRDAFSLSITTPGGGELGRESPYYVGRQIADEALKEESWGLGVGSFLFGIDDDDDIEDEDCWIKGQPSLGWTIPVDAYRQQLIENKIQGKESEFERFQLCRFTTSDAPWLVGDLWDGARQTAAGPGPDDAVVVGFDFSRTFDLTSACMAWWDGETLRTQWRHWAIRKPKGQQKRDYQRYLDGWARRDNVVVCDHSVQYDDIYDWLWELKGSCNLVRVGYDALSGMHTTLADWGDLEEKYNPQTMLPMAKVPQTVTTFGPATYLVEGFLRSGTMTHPGDPVVDYAVSNVQLEQNVNGDRRPSKVRSSGIIDPVVALCMAAHCLIEEKMTKPGAYNTDAEIAL
jgi:phage terminase large subunit-like protein